ncbi:MAG: phage distal tail protein, partial [Eggerthella lenta]
QVTSTQRSIAAGGNYRAYPKVTCKPPAGSSWTLTNVSSGRFVRVEANFTGAQTVVLDMRAERCTVNGADWPVTITSDFFALDGVQKLKTSGGTAMLEWEERWL